MNVAQINVVLLRQREIDAREVLSGVERLSVLIDCVAPRAGVSERGCLLFHRAIKLCDCCSICGDALRAEYVIRNCAAGGSTCGLGQL